MPEPRWYPYLGGRAVNYEATRRASPIWDAEYRALEKMLDDVTAGSTVLDVPVGTGRFLELYEALGLDVIGMDISDEMLEIARAKQPGADLILANVLDIPLPDKSVDIAVCVRMLYFLRPDEMARAMSELRRVTREKMIVTAHVGARHREPTTAPIIHAMAAVTAAGGTLIDDQTIRDRGRGVRYAMLSFSGDA